MKASPSTGFAAALTLALCIVWGFNQVVVKLALSEVGPIAQTGIRSAIGVLCVAAYALLAKRRIFELDGTEAPARWPAPCLPPNSSPSTNCCASQPRRGRRCSSTPRRFSSRSARRSCSRTSGCGPSNGWVSRFAFVGLACGLAGRAPGGGAIGDALALLAAALWGATTILIKATSLRRADPVKVLLYQIALRDARRAVRGLRLRRGRRRPTSPPRRSPRSFGRAWPWSA